MTRLTWARRLPLGIATTAALLMFGGGVAQASSCGATWTGGGGDDLWSDAANWSPGAIPGNVYSGVPYEPLVCIPAGSYTVVLNYQTTVGAISLGAGSTLDIWGQQNFTHGGLWLNNQDNGSGIASGATVVLGIGNMANTTHGGFDALSGTLVNNGLIVSANTLDETPNFISGNFDNVGTLTVNGDLQGTPASWTLGGTVTVASGQAIALSGPDSGSANVTLAGTLTDNGSVSFANSTGAINVTAASGTLSGPPIVVGNGILSPSGSGSGSFHIMSGGAQLGSNIAAGYTVWASGQPGFSHGNLTPTGSFANAGTLELGSIDGTHGTLTVPSGDTFTNNGTLIFENTANGPDGLSGTLVNNGSVSVQNSFNGAGAITNNGAFELTAASGTSDAASFSQSSGGTLTLDLTGGSSAIVPQLDLTSTAATAGKLVVNTTGGTATGTFPVIIASQQSGAFATTFAGENYTVGYKSGTVSLTAPVVTAPATTTPPTITPTPAPLTEAQKLAKAIAKCETLKKAKKRAACIKLAKKTYPLSKHKKGKKGLRGLVPPGDLLNGARRA
jgi:hypothetical protein